MAKTESAILKYTADGFAENPDLYEDIFLNFITNNTDLEGNIIDNEEYDKQMLSLRNAFNELGMKTFTDVIEEVTIHEKFGGTAEFLQFLDITKRFIYAAEKEPRKIGYYTSYWEKSISGIKVNGIEKLAKANLTLSVYEDIESLLNRIKK